MLSCLNPLIWDTNVSSDSNYKLGMTSKFDKLSLNEFCTGLWLGIAHEL